MFRTIFGALSLVFSAVWLSAQQSAPPDGQQPPVTFKVEINYVEVDAIVTDQQGQFVRGLTRGDFEVLENGKRQPISIFSMVDIPLQRADAPLFAAQPIEPDVATNAGEFNGRVYVLLLDDLHTHPLRSSRVKAAARRFLEQHFGANDIAAVVHTSGRSDAGQEFTSNRRLLLRAVDKFMGRKIRSATLGKIDDYFARRGTPRGDDRLRDPGDVERGVQARSTLSTLKGVAEFVSGVRGRRKAVIFVSEGIDYDIADVFNAQYASTVHQETRDAIAAATRANVSVYSVDPRGLTALGDESIEIQGLPDDPSLGLGQTSLQDAAPPRRGPRPAAAHRRKCERRSAARSRSVG
ncbi:MAG: VWA domain-containing protein [Acidobacteria bacterium]|nr:VWA domain-containing protein [Acidobacteriota bacterium]